MNRKDLTSYIVTKQWCLDRLSELETRKEIINRLTALYGQNEGRGSRKINDKLAEDLVELLDETNKYTIKLKEIEKRNFKVIEILDKMENAIYRQILSDRYIKGIDLKEIADKPYIKRDAKYIYNMHGYALKEFDEVCKKDFENNVTKMEKNG